MALCIEKFSIYIKNNPQTGEHSNINLGVVLVAISVLVIVVETKKIKRIKKWVVQQCNTHLIFNLLLSYNEVLFIP